MIRSMVAGAMDSAAEASARIEADGREADAGSLDEIVAGALFLSEASEQVIALRQGGDVEEARAALEEASPRIAEFGIVISEVAEQQRQEVPAFRSRADRTADLAFWLLIISGAGGVILGLAASVFIARSILKPLSSVESVALAVAGGDFEARAQTSGPKELARLGTSLNQMTESLLGLNRSREEEVGELEKEIAERTRVEEKLRELLESAPDATIIVDSSGAIRLVNAQAERLFGYRREELLGLPVEALMSDGERGRHAYDRASYFANPHPRAMGSGLELYARHKDGSKIPVEISLSPIGAEEGGLVSTSIRDITERKRTEEALRESETNSRTLAKFRTLMESIAAACFIFKGTKIWYTNSASEAMTGYTREELLAMNFWDMIHPEFRKFVQERSQNRQQGEPVPSSYEVKIVVKSGEERWISFTTSRVEFDGQDAVLGTAFDITERKRAEAAAREQARRDSLTKVLNHGAILEEIQGLLADGGPGVSHAVAMIDVDGLKAVNDASGHQVGDAVLRAVTGALSKDGAIVGRYGGDEFVAVLPGADRAGAERYRDGVLKKLQGARVTDPATGARVPVAASIGLSVYPAEANTIGEMIRLSDRAMYASRRQRPIRADGRSPAGALGSDRAAEMVGQIVPLLTSPGQLEDKLRLVSQRICVGAGYDAVNIDLFDEAGSISRVRSAFSEVPDEVVEAWRAQRRRIEEEPILQEIRSSGRAVIVDDPQNDERLTEAQRAVLRAAELRSAVVTPLFWGEQFIGALSVASKREAAFTVLDVEFLTAVADQVTAIARMANMVEELQSTSARLATAQDQTVMLLAAAAEAHDETTGLHLRGVRALVETLAQELGYDENEARDMGLAAVLHDIGKIRVADSILACNGPLPAEDWEIMKQHTIWGAELLADRPGLELAGTIARSHHEQWDGSGYPDGLAGEAVPEQVSIVTVADALDAMTHDRPYQASRSDEEAVREIARCSGQQFSPRVVEALQRLHRRDALPFPTAQAREDRAAA